MFVVCTNPETGKYIAFDAADPIKQVTTYSREGAISEFVVKYLQDVVEVYEQIPGESCLSMNTSA